MSPINKSIVIAIIFGIASVIGFIGLPKPVASSEKTFSLDLAIPKKVAGWTHLPAVGMQVVNPQTKELLDKTYSEILTRTYTNSDGHRVMLSIAYGSDQRGGLQAHKPELCYPAQGFQLRSTAIDKLRTPMGSIDVRRVFTNKGERFEPLTYWFTVGDSRVVSGFERRMAEIKALLTGQIPDGLIFRVSSIDRDSKRAWDIQDQFVNQLLSSLTPDARAKVTGLRANLP